MNYRLRERKLHVVDALLDYMTELAHTLGDKQASLGKLKEAATTYATLTKDLPDTGDAEITVRFVDMSENATDSDVD